MPAATMAGWLLPGGAIFSTKKGIAVFDISLLSFTAERTPVGFPNILINIHLYAFTSDPVSASF
nr:hypothetical protein [uncultured Roseococcus sp.]